MVTDKERIASLEVQAKATNDDIKDHSARIDILEKGFLSLVYDIRLIRYALIFLAGSAVPGAIKQITAFLSGN